LTEDVLTSAVSTRTGILVAAFDSQHAAGCDGCTTYLRQTQQIIAALQGLAAARDNGEGVATHRELNQCRPALARDQSSPWWVLVRLK
jgi:anti-sigma factor RsiW